MKKIILLYLIAFACVQMYGQDLSPDAIVSSGGDFSSSAGMLSFSLGECVIETLNQSNGTLTQGFQQGDYDVVSFVLDPASNLQMTVYPVPAKDFIKIETRNLSGNFHAALYDLSGKVVLSKDLTDKTTTWDIRKIDAGQYMLKVTEKSGKPIQSFKIIKY